jgi:hypothetical protein
LINLCLGFPRHLHNNHDMPLVSKGSHSRKLAVSTMTAFRLVILSLLLLAAPSVGETDDSEVEATIVGGQDASPGAYPFMVQWSGCGASLIWKDMLLTAAHVRRRNCLECIGRLVLSIVYSSLCSACMLRCMPCRSVHHRLSTYESSVMFLPALLLPLVPTKTPLFKTVKPVPHMEV